MKEVSSHSALYEQSSKETEQAYLAALGERVRSARALRGMTRKILASDSGVSERYLAELESGRGNISILLLRQLSLALDTRLEALVREGPEAPLEFQLSVELLGALSQAELEQAHHLLSHTFRGKGRINRRNFIALVGLRGAGKSTLGTLLSQKLGFPFVELDKEIELEAGAPLAAIFDLYGQAGFRRLERRVLERILETYTQAVIATGGGLIADAGTFERLLSSCFTVWIKASPSEHMERVIAQGDLRPMADNREAMADLQRILKGREPLYSKADVQIDTSARSIPEALKTLYEAIT